MSRIVRLHEPHQPALPLGHGPVHWDTLPSAVRDHVLVLWIQLLTEHVGHVAETVSVPAATGERVAGRP